MHLLILYCSKDFQKCSYYCVIYTCVIKQYFLIQIITFVKFVISNVSLQEPIFT